MPAELIEEETICQLFGRMHGAGPVQRGYPLHMISAAVAKVSYVDRPKYLQQSPRHNNSGSVCAFVIPYVDGTADMRLQQLLHEVYMEHPELQAYIPEKPLVSFKKSRNLGSRLVRAGA